MTTTISGATTTSNLTIEAPRTPTQFPAYFLGLINSNGLTDTPGAISISFPTTFTGFNLTSFGRTDSTDGFSGTIWRLRNGETIDELGTLSGYGSEISNSYNLEANTDTFVFSSFDDGAATHILSVDDRRIVKAASSNLFREKDEDPIDGDSYKIIGGSGDDSLIGANLNDTLMGLDGDDTLRGFRGNDLLLGGNNNDLLSGGRGRDSLEGGNGSDRLFGNRGNDSLTGGNGRDRLFGARGNDLLEGGNGTDLLVGGRGNDILTGDAGRDRFRFTNQGNDSVRDFSLADRDIFQIRSNSYTNAPTSDTTPVLGTVGTSGVNIYIDTSINIGSDSSGSVYFAYAADTDELLYDADGDWTSGTNVIAITNNFGTPTSANFDFI